MALKPPQYHYSTICETQKHLFIWPPDWAMTAPVFIIFYLWFARNSAHRGVETYLSSLRILENNMLLLYLAHTHNYSCGLNISRIIAM